MSHSKSNSTHYCFRSSALRTLMLALGDFRRKIYPRDGSFCPSNATHKGFHRFSMNSFSYRAADQKSCASRLNVCLAIALAVSATGCNKEEQQANQKPTEQVAIAQNTQTTIAPAVPAQPVAKPAAKPLSDLESLAAPIALYPDPLLAELLVASTYPLEVVQAARWLETNPDPATLNDKDWDASVMRLTSVPSVIKMMNDHLDWTTQLGDAFLAKPAEMMDVIQTLRKRAKDSGFLKDTPEQKISTQTVAFTQPAQTDAIKPVPAVMQREVISIAPAKSDTVYVPQYNPETVYQAPLAAQPASGYTTQATGYYPVYTPAPSSTNSSTDSLLTFGAGALVGGLLTWGIMEWADDDDDWDDYHHVSHYYGDTVCHNGNCWNRGNGYYGDRGNVNYNKNVNVSGNEINIDRSGHFNQNNLKPSQRPDNWRPNPKHRRGQEYPEALKNRLGSGQPALAGQRLGSAQTLPASTRGFAEAGQRLEDKRRPSSDDIRQQLVQKTDSKLKPVKPSTLDTPAKQIKANRDNAFEGIKNSDRASRLESQRGEKSRAFKLTENQAIQAKNKRMAENRPAASDNKQTLSKKMPAADRSQGFVGQERSQQRRAESARPNAFEAPRNAGSTRDFSKRGESSIKRASETGRKNHPAAAGGGKRNGGGGRRR